MLTKLKLTCFAYLESVSLLQQDIASQIKGLTA